MYGVTSESASQDRWASFRKIQTHILHICFFIDTQSFPKKSKRPEFDLRKSYFY